MVRLEEILVDIATGLVSAKTEKYSGHPIANAIRNELKDAVENVTKKHYPDLVLKSSAGAGRWADVPWLAIFDPRITRTSRSAFYPIYLFKADGSGVYLSLNQGMTIPTSKYGAIEANRRSSEFKNKLLVAMPTLKQWGEQEINLATKSEMGRSYENPNISAKYYPSKDIPDSRVLEHDLIEMLGFYDIAKQHWIENTNRK